MLRARATLAIILVVALVASVIVVGMTFVEEDAALPSTPGFPGEEASHEMDEENTPRPPLELMHVVDAARARPATPFEGFDTFNLNLADVSGNGRPEIVTFNDNARAYVIDPVTGRVLAEIETAHPYHDIDAWHRQTLNGIGIGDVDGNGRVELALLNTAARLELHEFDPANSTDDRYAFQKHWEKFVTLPRYDEEFFDENSWWDEDAFRFGAHGHPFIADVGDPGGARIFAQSDDWPGQFVFNADGDLVWSRDAWDGHAGPWVGDLTGDGRYEAVFPSDNGRVGVFDAESGSKHWVFNVRDHGVKPGSIPVTSLVADLDGDGDQTLFVSARVAVKNPEDPDWMEKQNAVHFLLDADGQVVWRADPEWGNPLSHTNAVPFDVNGDDVRDLLVMDWNTIGHNPGNWEYLGPANLFVLDGRDGTTVWRTEVDMEFSRGNVAVADFLPDEPGPEVLAPDRRDGVDGLALIGILDGEKRAWFSVPDAWTITRGPALADVTGDGRMEAVVPVARPATDCALPADPDVEREDVGCREGALLVYRTNATEDATVWSNNLHYNAARDTETRLAAREGSR